MLKKVPAFILSVCLAISPILTSNALAADSSSSDSGDTRLFGQVTAISGSSITLALYSTPGGEQPSEAPANSSSDSEENTPPTGSPPTDAFSSSDSSSGSTTEIEPPSGTAPGGGGGTTGGMTLSGETETITVSDSTTITINSKSGSSAGELSDVTVGCTLSATISDGAVTEIMIMEGMTAGSAGTAAAASSSAVTVNGTAVSFQAYNIGGNNFFKLRDIAKVLGGTDKQFEVGWDATNSAISLTTGAAYTAVGGELSNAGSTAKVSATISTAKVYLDAMEVSLTAYNIDGNNYFKLRDLASALDFGVTWDAATSTVGIDTSTGYTA